jgi:hypothetical protein
VDRITDRIRQTHRLHHAGSPPGSDVRIILILSRKREFFEVPLNEVREGKKNKETDAGIPAR